MHYLITGGKGFLGNKLVKTLAHRNNSITIISRSQEQNNDKYDSSGVHTLSWDQKVELQSVIETTDVVIHLSGENIGGKSLLDLVIKRWTRKQKQKIIDSRVETGKKLVELIKRSTRKPRLFIQASAVGYYGDAKDRILDENAPQGKDFLANVCAAWENATFDLETSGIRRIVLRIAGMVLASDGGSLPFFLLPFRLFLGGQLGSGSQWQSWIHYQDLVNAILFLVEDTSAEPGIYNLCSPNPVINAEFARVVGGVLARPSWLPVPAFALRLLLGEKSSLLLASQRQVPARLMASGFNFQYPDLGPALRELQVFK